MLKCHFSSTVDHSVLTVFITIKTDLLCTENHSAPSGFLFHNGQDFLVQRPGQPADDHCFRIKQIHHHRKNNNYTLEERMSVNDALKLLKPKEKYVLEERFFYGKTQAVDDKRQH